MEFNALNIGAGIIVGMFLVYILYHMFKGFVNFVDTLKNSAKGKNPRGQTYVTEQRMEEYYKSKTTPPAIVK